MAIARHAGRTTLHPGAASPASGRAEVGCASSGGCVRCGRAGSKSDAEMK
ncbi:MAG: hypothetical protein SPH82_06755 [Eubacteriales bacterium]|nr:hypothetical protein [Eubacteriales bacterium]